MRDDRVRTEPIAPRGLSGDHEPRQRPVTSAYAALGSAGEPARWTGVALAVCLVAGIFIASFAVVVAAGGDPMAYYAKIILAARSHLPTIS